MIIRKREIKRPEGAGGGREDVKELTERRGGRASKRLMSSHIFPRLT
jgi:hypothetical protein